jgi:hypothetical protein
MGVSSGDMTAGNHQGDHTAYTSSNGEAHTVRDSYFVAASMIT